MMTELGIQSFTMSKQANFGRQTNSVFADGLGHQNASRQAGVAVALAK